MLDHGVLCRWSRHISRRHRHVQSGACPRHPLQLVIALVSATAVRLFFFTHLLREGGDCAGSLLDFWAFFSVGPLHPAVTSPVSFFVQDRCAYSFVRHVVGFGIEGGANFWTVSMCTRQACLQLRASRSFSMRLPLVSALKSGIDCWKVQIPWAFVSFSALVVVRTAGRCTLHGAARFAGSRHRKWCGPLAGPLRAARPPAACSAPICSAGSCWRFGTECGTGY